MTRFMTISALACVSIRVGTRTVSSAWELDARQSAAQKSHPAMSDAALVYRTCDRKTAVAQRNRWSSEVQVSQVEQVLQVYTPKVGDLVRIVIDNMGIMLNTDLIGKSGLVMGVDDSMGVLRVLVHVGDRQLLLFPDMLEVVCEDTEDNSDI